ncbi:radical SAM protein [Candidatus Woesearchaeota archaeon]|nr:radical SAM protein [Candidatus Woesearchaeota archaeon]
MAKLKRAAFTLWSKCNGSCGYCFNRERKQDELQLRDSQSISLNEFQGILREAKFLGLEDIELSGGEPFLHPKIVLDMVKYAGNNEILAGIFTNGTLLNGEILNSLSDVGVAWLRFSLGGYDFKTHSLERKGTPKMFENVINAVNYSIQKGIKTRLFVPITQRTFPFIERTSDFIAEQFPGLEHVAFDCYIPNGVPEKDKRFLMSPEQHYAAIDSLLKSRRKHEGKLKVIPYYGCFEFLSPEWAGEEVLKSQCGKERLAFLANGDVTPCLCTLDVLGNFREEGFNLKKIVETMPHPEHYDFSSYAPCSSCNKYQICHDSWCPSLTVNGRGNYQATPSTCPAVRKFESSVKDGITPEEAIKQALERHNLR